MINLSDTFYDLVAKNKIENISKIGGLIHKLIFSKQEKPSDNEICRLIDAEKKNSFIHSQKGIIESLKFLLGNNF
jgi:hypothetical protein